MRTEPKATYCPKHRRIVLEDFEGWTRLELHERYGRYPNGEWRGLALRHRRAAQPVAA